MSNVILKSNDGVRMFFSKKNFNVFHIVFGSGTIKGSVKQDNGSVLSGVNVSFAIYGSTVDNTTTDSSGDFSKSLNSLGVYTLTYSKSGYLGATQSGTLATDYQTLVVGTLSQLAEGCLAGTLFSDPSLMLSVIIRFPEFLSAFASE